MHADGRSHRRAASESGDSVARASGDPPAASITPQAGARSAVAERVVLVIEDEPNITEAIRFILARDGWKVLTHAEGHDALARIEAVAPQLLILDVMLPGRSGMDILQALRGHERLADLPVIMLTAKGQAAERDTALRHGASLFMTKPFSNADLLAAARRLAGA